MAFSTGCCVVRCGCKPIAPTIGLAVAALALRYLAHRVSPSTADEYIRSFHDNERRLDLQPVPGRVAASVATLGSGAPMGFEGPSIYMGAAIGAWLQHRFSRFFARTDTKVLLVCGAAAGVAAIFKAPATGMVFALEVPYREDLARRMLLPAMFAAATSYVVYVAINGTSVLLPVNGAPRFDFRDLVGAAALGLACGAGAQLFARGVLAGKAMVSKLPAVVRVLVFGLSIALLFVAGRLLTGESLVVGPGYSTIDWALQPTHAFAVIVALFFVRGLATICAVAGGGAGGLFVPLVVQGALLGSAVSSLVHASPENASLFPLLGVAAFLGAGYRVPTRRGRVRRRIHRTPRFRRSRADRRRIEPVAHGTVVGIGIPARLSQTNGRASPRPARVVRVAHRRRDRPTGRHDRRALRPPDHRTAAPHDPCRRRL